METKVYTKSVYKKSINKDNSLLFNLEDKPIRDRVITDYLDSYE